MSEWTDVEREYPYRLRWTVIAGALALSLGCLSLLGFVALANDKGMAIPGTLGLSAAATTVIFWIAFGLFAAMAACILFLAFHQIICPQRLALGKHALFAPVSRWSPFEREIPYDEMLHAYMLEPNEERTLCIALRSEATYVICASRLPSRQDFEEIHQRLTTEIIERHKPKL